MQDALNELKLVSQLQLDAQEQALLGELFLLTVKPRMYVLNVSEDALGDANALLDSIASAQEVDEAALTPELQGVAKIARRARTEGAEEGKGEGATGTMARNAPVTRSRAPRNPH